MNPVRRPNAHRALATLGAFTLLLLLAGLCAGGEGWQWPVGDGAQARLILWEIRLPRSLGAWAVGALLGWAGAVAQGLLRNPLADPYLLGTASGASLAVVLVLSVGGVLAQRLGLVGAALLGALGGTALTLALARGAHHTSRLLLAGIAVGVMLAAASELLASLSPHILRSRQAFLLGSTSLMDATATAWALACLGGVLLAGTALARVLDALVLGEDSARSLGLDVARWRAVLLGLMSLATAVAVAVAGLVAFVGLVAPHLTRRLRLGTQRHTLWASAALGGLLLLAADIAARLVLAPRELPVGVLTAFLGGLYLVWALGKAGARS